MFQVLGSRVGARGISLMYSTLCWNPAWRSSAQEALKHSYFRLNSQPSSASSNHHAFALALKPTVRSRRSVQREEGGGGGGVRVQVPLNPVEAVYDRDGLRNYRESSAAAAATEAAGTVVTQKDQDDLKLLLESLKANDVMPVVAPYRKPSNNNNNFSHQQQQHRTGHRPSFLNLDGEEPNGEIVGGGGSGRRSPPPFSFAKYPKLGGSHGPLPPPASYVPSFGAPRQAAPLSAAIRNIDSNHHHQELSHNGPVIGRGLFGEEKDSNQNPAMANGRVHFGGTRETVANFSTKVDFTARVVESFSGFHLDGGDSTMLGTGVLAG